MASNSPGAKVGRRLRRLREERFMSQEALAQAAGLSAPTVIKIERGQRRLPQHKTLEKLAGALGITVDGLIGTPRPLAPPLALHTMYAENDEGIRRRALEAATEDELAAYRADLDRAIERAEAVLMEDAKAAASATDDDAKRSYTGRRAVLRRYIGRLAALSDEAAGVSADPPTLQQAEELLHA